MLHTMDAHRCLYDWDMSEDRYNHILKEEALVSSLTHHAWLSLLVQTFNTTSNKVSFQQ